MDVDKDVVDNVDESLYIAFCGPAKLTKSGEARFSNVLDLDIEIDNDNDIVIIDVDAPGDEYNPRLRDAKKLFHALAGFVPESQYKLWIENNAE